MTNETISTRIYKEDRDYLKNKRGSKGIAQVLHEILEAWERSKPQ